MPACPKCGARVAEEARFCAACGCALEMAANAPAAPPPSSSPGGAQTGMTPNLAAMLAYVPFCLVGLVCAVLFGFILEPYKRNEFIRFHAFQSLAVHGVLLIFWIGWSICSGVLSAISHALAFITVPIWFLISLAALGLMIFLMIKAYGNDAYKLPLVGDWAEKQAKS